MNKTIHTLTAITIIIELSGRGAGREQEHDVIGIFYYTRVWQQEGTAESTSGEPNYGPGWLSRPGERLSKACGNIGGS